MYSERRTGSRYPIRVDVILDDETRFRCGATLDLSYGGALVESREALRVGTAVRLVPLCDMRVAVFELKGHVLRSVAGDDGGFLIALALDLSAHERRAYAGIFEREPWTFGAPPRA